MICLKIKIYLEQDSYNLSISDFMSNWKYERRRYLNKIWQTEIIWQWNDPVKKWDKQKWGKVLIRFIEYMISLKRDS